MEAISEYLEKNKMSQAQFGEKLGVGQAMVGNWLSRRRGVSLDKALEIEEVFGVQNVHICPMKPGLPYEYIFKCTK